jgi:hypothetical protein
MVAVLCLSISVQAQTVVQPQPVQMQSMRGVVKSVDGTSMTMMMGTTEKKLDVVPNVPVFTTQVQGGRLIRRRGQTVMVPVANGLASVQPNTQVMCTTEMRDGREVVTQIRLEGNVVGPTIIR